MPVGNLLSADDARRAKGGARVVEIVDGGEQGRAAWGGNQRRWARRVQDLAVEGEADVFGMAVDHLALEVGAGKPDLVIKPDVHASVPGAFADGAKDLPPLVGHERWVVGEVTIEGAGWCQADDGEIEDPALAKAVELPGQSVEVEAVAAPPPEGIRRVGRLGCGESIEQCLLRRHSWNPLID